MKFILIFIIFSSQNGDDLKKFQQFHKIRSYSSGFAQKSLFPTGIKGSNEQNTWSK